MYYVLKVIVSLKEVVYLKVAVFEEIGKRVSFLRLGYGDGIVGLNIDL